MIEAWERLDCESVGSVEISAIADAVRERFGETAVDGPMTIARILADEGAELRHAEIMGLHVAHAAERPYDAAFRNLIDVSTLTRARTSLRNMENLRRKFASDEDREGARLLAAMAREEREQLMSGTVDGVSEIQTEIAEWLRIWLGSPEIFENWLGLRLRSEDFRSRFGDI